MCFFNSFLSQSYSNALEMTHIALTADIARTNTTIASNLTDVNQSVNTIKNLR